MSYIWENYSDKKRFCVGRKISPYFEILTENNTECEVNPLLRFQEIFTFETDDWKEDLEENCVNFKELENIVLHYLAQLDRLFGTNKKQLKVNCADSMIRNGGYGEKIRQNWEKLHFNERHVILNTLIERFESESVDNFLFKAAGRIFPAISLIYEKSSGTYYFYVNAKETDYNKIVMEVLVFFFHDIQNKTEVVWENHYGIIGCADTMRISEIKIL